MSHGDVWEGYTNDGADASKEIARLTERVAQLEKFAQGAADLVAEYAAKAGFFEGQLKGFGMNGGVQATLDKFREENERLRKRIARLEKR